MFQLSDQTKNKLKTHPGARAAAYNETFGELQAAKRLDTIREAKALSELLAKSPNFAQGVQKYQQTYLEKLESIKREIKSIRGLRLNRLEEAGAKPEMILHVLAMEVLGCSWPREVRRIKETQKKLAARLRENAEMVERMYGDDASYPDLYTIIPPEARDGPAVPASERVPGLLIQEMRARADELDGFAREFGRLLKSRFPKLERQYIVGLLEYVHHATEDVHRHLVLLAAMLTDIYVKCGIEKRVSPESLAKIFERHVTPRLRSADKTPA
jgi:hypothetical protein